MIVKADQDNDEIEKCVCCGKDTAYTFSIPIQERRYYVSGCGQLCEQCYSSVKSPEEE